jgi:hypothetical protein
MDNGPIFIAGLERSGTSLIYALLASHPRIAMSRRTNLWTHYYNQYGDLSKLENFERCLAMMMRYKRLLKLNPDPERIRREFWQGAPTYGRLFALLEEHFAEQTGKTRWGDKSLNTERYADEIFAAYPSARILHMIRDPRDRYASSLTRWKISRGGIGAATAMWLNSIRLAERNRRLHPVRYMLVPYESLAGQAEKTMREICAFVGEEYTPAVFDMQGAEQFRNEGGNSSYGHREPGKISTSSVGKFRKVLSSRQVAFMQLFAGKKMAAYGYEPDKVRLLLVEKILFILWDIPFDVLRMLAWLAREAFLNHVGRNVPSDRIVVNRELLPQVHKPG